LEYALAALPVECRGELLATQVFLPTEHLAADEMVWDFDTWAATERPPSWLWSRNGCRGTAASPLPRTIRYGRK
jgi:hypothetical protein